MPTHMPDAPLSKLILAANEALSDGEAGEIFAAVLWGSIIDVVAGKLDYAPERDVDVLAICANTAKRDTLNANGAGMPNALRVIDGFRLDIFYADLGYVAQAIEAGRWTVVRALADGPVVRDSPILAKLRTSLPAIEPFVHNSWRDWQDQAVNLMGKARRLIETGNAAHGELLMRDALNTFCYGLVFRKEGAPATPSSFPRLFARHYAGTQLFDFFFAFHGVSEITPIDAKLRFLTLTELLANTGEQRDA